MVKYDASSNTFTIETDEYKEWHNVIAPYSVTAELNQYASIHAVSSEGTVEFDSPCTDPSVFEATAQGSMKVNFHGPTTFNINRFEIEPKRCLIETRCTKVERTDGQPSDISCSDFSNDGVAALNTLVLTTTGDDYTSRNIKPGNYIVTLTGTATRSKDQRTRETTFALQVQDPCDPPAEFYAAGTGFVTQDYVLAQDAITREVTAADFVVKPVYCPISVPELQDLTKFADGSSAVSTSGNSASVFWDQSQYPLGRTQTAKFVATAGSIYGEATDSLSATTDIVYTFSDPCGNPTYTTLTATPQTSPDADNYSGTDIVFKYEPFVVEPAFCPTTITCEYVSPATPLSCKELSQSGEARWNFKPTDTMRGITAGEYSFFYAVSAGQDASLNKIFEVKVVLTTDEIVANFPVIQDILERLEQLENQAVESEQNQILLQDQIDSLQEQLDACNCGAVSIQ